MKGGIPTSPYRRVVAAVFAAAAMVCMAPVPVAGQSLHLAELFAEQGRLGDARAEVEAWFEIRGDAATPEELQHGLWLRGRLAADRVAGLADLERLVEGSPDGPYTARALLWLADAASEAGDEGAAMAHRARIARDFPESEEADQAREWLHARGLSVEKPASPVKPAADSVPAADEPTAAADSLPDVTEGVPIDTVPAVPPADSVPPASARPAARADSIVAPAPDSTPPDPVPADPPPVETPVDTASSDPVPADTTPAEPAPPEPAPATPQYERVPPGDPVPGAADDGAFAVQIGAFRNPDGAAGLVDELVEAGFDARLVQVPTNDLLRVRVGRFATLDDATRELARVRAGGYDGAVVNDARRETVVSR